MSGDRFVTRAVVCLLGAVALLLTGALAVIAVTGHDVRDPVLALLAGQLGGAVGALGALLAHPQMPAQVLAQVPEDVTPAVGEIAG